MVTEAVPRVSVFYEQAKVTHEVAIASVDKKHVETLYPVVLISPRL